MVAPITGTPVPGVEAAADRTVLPEGIFQEFAVIVEVYDLLRWLSRVTDAFWLLLFSGAGCCLPLGGHPHMPMI